MAWKSTFSIAHCAFCSVTSSSAIADKSSKSISNAHLPSVNAVTLVGSSDL